MNDVLLGAVWAGILTAYWYSVPAIVNRLAHK
jgi:hypothetical protein